MRKLAILLPILMITACDKLPFSKNKQEEKQSASTVASSTQNIESTINTVKNPCLDKDLIQGVKQGVIDRADEIITTKESQEFSYLTHPLIQDTVITFYNISEPHEFMNKESVCEASIKVEYIGDEETPPSTLQQMVKFLSTDLPYSSDPIAQMFTGQAYQKQLQKFGLNQYSLDDIRSINGNVFETTIRYTSTKTYTENGQAQQGWSAYFGETPSLLATTAAYDILVRNLNKRKNKTAQTSQETQPSEGESIAEPSSNESSESEKPSNQIVTKEANDSVKKQKENELARKQKEWEEEQSKKADELDNQLQKQLNDSSKSDSDDGIVIK